MSEKKKWWRVTTTNWQCTINQFVVTKETEKTVTFIDKRWNMTLVIPRPTRNNKVSDDYQWFKTLDEAKVRARDYIIGRIKFHEKRIEDFRGEYNTMEELTDE